MKFTLIFSFISFFISFYFLEIFLEENVYGENLENLSSYFFFNLNHPLNYKGFPLLISAFNHMNWLHFFTNVILFIILSSILEKLLPFYKWIFLCFGGHIFGVLISLIIFALSGFQRDHFITGSSIIIFSFFGFLLIKTKNKYLLFLIIPYLAYDFISSGLSLSTSFSFIGHISGLCFGISYAYFKLARKLLD